MLKLHVFPRVVASRLIVQKPYLHILFGEENLNDTSVWQWKIRLPGSPLKQSLAFSL